MSLYLTMNMLSTQMNAYAADQQQALPPAARNTSCALHFLPGRPIRVARVGVGSGRGGAGGSKPRCFPQAGTSKRRCCEAADEKALKKTQKLS